MIKHLLREDLFEIRRKLFHVLGGALILTGLLSGYLSRWMLLLCTLGIIVFSYISKRFAHPVIMFTLRLFEREKNIHKFPLKGMFFFFLGCTIPLFIFPFSTAILSIIILTVGDATSALVGKYFGRTKHPMHTTKMIEGHITGGLLAFAVALFANYLYHYGFIWWQILISSMVTMFIEGIEHLGKHEWIDDNLTIPLIAGILLQILPQIPLLLNQF